MHVTILILGVPAAVLLTDVVDVATPVQAMQFGIPYHIVPLIVVPEPTAAVVLHEKHVPEIRA